MCRGLPAAEHPTHFSAFLADPCPGLLWGVVGAVLGQEPRSWLASPLVLQTGRREVSVEGVGCGSSSEPGSVAGAGVQQLALRAGVPCDTLVLVALLYESRSSVATESDIQSPLLDPPTGRWNLVSDFVGFFQHPSAVLYEDDQRA